MRRGLRPLLAGRRADALAPLAHELGLETRAFDLDQPTALSRGLAGAKLVLHAAGPFSRTSLPMVNACLAAGAHYLDITGEIAVFEAIFRRDEEARRACVGLLPGVGFDVVPSDALAATLLAAAGGSCPQGELDLAFASVGDSTVSRGTLVTMLESAPYTGCVRRDGRLCAVPLAWRERQIHFPTLGSRQAMTIPWGDLSTAYRTTGIGNITTWVAQAPSAIARLRRLRPLLPLAALRPLRRLAQRLVRRRWRPPEEAVRHAARVHLWGELRFAPAGGKSKDQIVSGALSVPEGYEFTAAAAVEAARRALAGELSPGAQTPTQAFGRTLLDSLPGVVWTDDPTP